MLRRVALVRTDVSEELSASFIRVTRIGELGTTLAVTSNRRSVRGQRGSSPRPLISVFQTGAMNFFFQGALHLSPRGRVDPVLDPLLLRKCGSAGNRTRDLWICSQEL
jgi:hypothetical protein